MSKKKKEDKNIEEEVVQEENQVIELNIDYKDAYIRATADYKNLKREMAQKQGEYVAYANQNMLEELIPVVEHFHQGLKYIPEDLKKENWMIGFEQIQKQLNDFTERNGLIRIKTVGEKFNPDKHEAVSRQSKEGSDSDVILEEIMGGYELNGKVIQAAKVVVAE